MPSKILTFALFFTFFLLINAHDSAPIDIRASYDQPSPDTSFQTTSLSDSNTRQNIFPLSPSEIYGLVLIMIFAGLANSGGLGGATLLTPVLIILFNYSESHAIEMVYALVFGGSVGNFINLVTKRDAKTNKPLIEYDLGLICMPLMLLGATIGVILNRMLAPLVILIGLVCIMLYSLTRMYVKARKQYADETKQKERERESLLVKEDTSFETGITGQAAINTCPQIPEIDEIETMDLELEAVLKADQLLFPKKKLIVTGSLIVVIILLALLRGTDNFSSIVGIPFCGGGYWALIALTVIVCVAALLLNIRMLKEPLRIKKEHGIVTRPGRFELSEDQKGKLIILSLIAGILAGLLGIGGGMVMGPTLINIGVPAQGLAATSGFFIVQTSFISLVQSCLYRDLPLEDQGFLMVLSIIGSFGVSFVLNWLVKKYQRPSLVLITLITVLSVSMVATPVYEIVSNIGNFGQMMSFSPIC